MVTYWDEVEAVMLRPFEWGVCDCCTSVCDLLAMIFGVDPMRDLRGSYDSHRGARRVIGRAGGLARLAADRFARCGLAPCAAAVPGAVGIGSAMPWPALVFCPEPGVWVGKSPAGYVAGLPVVEGATWAP